MLITNHKLKFILLVSIVALGILWLVSRPDGKTKVIFCDVGQGDGVLIIKGETQVLIDTGPDNGRMEKCLSQHLPFWDRQLEAVIISHWDSDHSGGLKGIFEKYRANKLYANQLPESGFEQKHYSGDLRQNDVLRVGGIEFDVRWPKEIGGDSNTDSVVLEAEIGSRKYLFTGDAPVEVEQKLVWRKILETRNEMLETRIIKISHHGSNTGTSAELLDYWQPTKAVISVGKNNKFGHPSNEVLKRLLSGEIELHRTDVDGEIRFID